MAVKFEFDSNRTLAAVVYLASKEIPRLDKYKICKLLFLADKKHLVRYGRPITGDTYYALNWGPVPSTTLQTLSNQHPLEERLRALLKRQGDRCPHYSLRRFKSTKLAAKNLIEEFLSESDIEVLDEIIEKNGRKTFDQLCSMTHAIPAYFKAWARRGEANRSIMHFEEFFEGDPDANQGLREELLAHASLIEAIEVLSDDDAIEAVQPRTVRGHPAIA